MDLQSAERLNWIIMIGSWLARLIFGFFKILWKKALRKNTTLLSPMNMHRKKLPPRLALTYKGSKNLVKNKQTNKHAFLKNS